MKLKSAELRRIGEGIDRDQYFQIAADIADMFRCFRRDGSPIRERPIVVTEVEPLFYAGVDVGEVVLAVLILKEKYDDEKSKQNEVPELWRRSGEGDRDGRP